MEMESFNPVTALLGGGLIGMAAAMLLALNGQIAGISGIVGGLLARDHRGRFWRLAFLGGLVCGAGFHGALAPTDISMVTSLPGLIVGGLLVGVGTRLGSGCTSGHGVCGIARLSRRSIVATVTFMLTAAATVFVVRHVVGGGG